MDPLLLHRLETEPEVEKKLLKLTKDYCELGKKSVDFWSNDWDVAHDIFMCYAALTRDDLEKLEKGHPKRFILPMSATQITTMATYIAQVLFGQDSPHKVDAGSFEDENKAEMMNQLLRWNAQQQATYSVGYLWILDSLLYNKGILYDSWQPQYEYVLEEVEYTDPSFKSPLPGESMPAGGIPKLKRVRRKRTESGGFVRFDLVSPYDFISDPDVPCLRMNEGRFAGHAFNLAFTELERRSKLDPTHPAFVLPAAIAKLKDKKPNKGTDSIRDGAGQGESSSKSKRVSRTSYERNRSTTGLEGTEKADKNDMGTIQCRELWVRINPDDYKLYSDEAGTGEAAMFQIIMASTDVILAINEVPLMHDMFPYAISEPRPSGHYQYAPSYAMILKPVQDYVDWLKNRHQDALSRTIGNIFVYDPAFIDVDDFLNPEKEGVLIALKDGAQGKKLSEIFQQIPLKDMTENFMQEMTQFIAYSETITGATAAMQGQIDGNPSATQFAGTQQMSAGRLSSIARLISVQALVPQTKRTVIQFQQFMPEAQEVRFRPNPEDLTTQQSAKFVKVDRDVIQGRFDYVAHDGTLPDTNIRKVAAIAKILEAAAAFPMAFQPAPGNLDPKLLIMGGAKAAGLKTDEFQYRQEDLQAAAAAQPAPPPPPQATPEQQAMAQAQGALGLATPPAAPPGALPNLQPGVIPLGDLGGRPPNIGNSVGLPDLSAGMSIEPPQVRPQNA